MKETAAEDTVALGLLRVTAAMADREVELDRDGTRQMPVKPRQCGCHRQCRRDTLTRCTLQPTYSLLYTF